MKTYRFLPAHSHLPGAKPELRRIAVSAVEWVSEKIADADADELVEVRSTCGDLHRVRAGDLRTAFPSLRRARRTTAAEVK